MPYADNHGVRIHYQVEGNGPPLVLQHGFTQSAKRWYFHGYVDALKSQYQLILVDARGHGQSDKPHDPAAYDVSLMAADVIAVLDALNLDKTHYWGYSMGAWIGYGVAKDALERVQTFILGGMHPYGRKLPPGSQLDGSDPEAFINAFTARLGIDQSAMPPEIREELFANDFQALSAAQQDFPSLAHIVPAMTMPCLLYAGENDATYHAKTRDCAGELPTALFFSLPKLDHAAGFRESGLVLPHVTAFLQEHC
jgi:pimeloyl-ACP methyl ester carboxylesterase